MIGLAVMTVAGTVTKDPEIRQVGEMSVANFGVAVNKKVKGVEKTLFIDCSVWGKKSEIIGQFLKKGNHITANGEFEMREWEKDGVVRMKPAVTVQNFCIYGRKPVEVNEEF